MIRVGLQGILGKMHPSTHGILLTEFNREGVDALVLFENQVEGSPHFGACSVLLVGALYNLKSIKDCEGHHLGDLPQEIKVPVKFCAMVRNEEGSSTPAPFDDSE